VHPSRHSKRVFTEEEDAQELPMITTHRRSAKKQKVERTEVTAAVGSANGVAALIKISRGLQMAASAYAGIGEGYRVAGIAWTWNARLEREREMRAT
jgi:hypothetical protein